MNDPIKTIVQGKLLFGNQKTYDKVLKMFQYRLENYYKSDVLLKEEEMFFEDDFTLNIPRFVGKALDKSWRNLISSLQYCAQFAISGEVRAWQTEEGNILNYFHIEPNSEKVAVLAFQKGRALLEESGKEQEALEALNEAIEKYNDHAQAYERRGRVNFILKKYHDALRDFDKCIKIDDCNPFAYYGKALVYLKNEEIEDAIENLELTLKKSVALQDIYWQARRLKAECHMKLKQYEKAAFDLKLFSNRKFLEDSPNLPWKKWAYFNHGKVLLELEQYQEALTAIINASEMESGKGDISEGQRFLYLGLAKHKAGKGGYIKDIKQAAALGEETAKQKLKELV